MIDRDQREYEGLFWDSAWILPYESDWSINEKFLYLNGYTHKLTNYAKGDPRKEMCADGREVTAAYRYNLWMITSSDEDDIDKSSCYYQLYSNTVRYCPECLNSGYHTEMHQLKFSAECPIHHVHYSDSNVKICRKSYADMPAYQQLSDNIKDPFHMIQGFKTMRADLNKLQFTLSPYRRIKALHINRHQQEMSSGLKDAIWDAFLGKEITDLISPPDVKDQITKLTSQFLMWREAILFSSKHDNVRYSDMAHEIDNTDFNTHLLFDNPYCILYCIIMSEYLAEYTYEEISMMESLLNCGLVKNINVSDDRNKKLYFVLSMWHLMLDYRNVVEAYPNTVKHSRHSGLYIQEDLAEKRSPFYIGDILDSYAPTITESSINATIWTLYIIVQETVREIYTSIVERYWNNPLEFSISPGRKPDVVSSLEFLIVYCKDYRFGVRIFSNESLERKLIA